MAKEYQGHHCKNCWNVALWIGNEEGLYREALRCKRYGRHAANRFIMEVVGVGAITPDGAKYTLRAVRTALQGLE